MTPELRQPVVDELPREIYLEVTNRCNLRCHTCPQSWGMSEPSADLSPEQVRKLLGQLPEVRRVVLHGIGEPTLNPALPEIVAVAKERGAHVLFNSNGLALTHRLSAALVDAGLDEIRVSMDSASAATYRAIRGADGFDKILRNLAGLHRAKDAAGSSRPRISLWMTGLKTNISELPDLVRVASDAGVAEVYVQRLVYSERGLARQDEALFGRGDPRTAEAVRAAEEIATQRGVTLRGSSDVLPDRAPDASKAAWRGCRRPWSLMYITANGTALPCCIAPFGNTPYEELRLGEAFVVPLEEIWNGAPYRTWRAQMLDGAPPAACAGCGSAWAL